MDKLIERGAYLALHIKKMDTELKEIKKEIRKKIDFEGKKSNTNVLNGIETSVKLNYKRNFDQIKLRMVKDEYPNTFFKVFWEEFKPFDKKIFNSYLNIGDTFSDALNFTFEEKEYAPTVTFNYLGEE